MPDAREHAPSYERNREPILAALEEILGQARPSELLELGSGTGQHAAYLAPRLPWLGQWRPTELEERLPSVRAWREASGADNLEEPVALDVGWRRWPVERADVILTINTLHIVPWEGVLAMIEGVGRTLRAPGWFVAYGPFRFGDRPLETSNERFEAWLQQTDPRRGLRRFERVDEACRAHGLQFGGDLPMPANNHVLWWIREPPKSHQTTP